MVSMSKALTLSQASTYYTNEDEKAAKASYWDKDSNESAWFGKQVEKLGYSVGGVVANEDFQHMIRQQNSDGFKVLKDGVSGEQRAGFDITLSATKELSILAEICGKSEFERAHDYATQKVMEYVQDNLAYTRVTNPLTKKREIVKVDSIVAASFKHHVNRAKDPQLHTHNVISDIAFYNGKNYSLEPSKIYENQKLLDQMYHNLVASELEKKLGYSVEFNLNEGGIFEARIAGLRPDLLEIFSKRTAEVKAKFEELKIKYPHEKPEVLKERAVLESRDLKGKDTKEQIHELWSEDLQKLGITKEQIFDALLKHENEQSISLLTKDEIIEKALKSLNKDAFFTKQEVLREALKLSQTQFSVDEIIDAVHHCSEIVEISQFQCATTTFIEAEKHILDLASKSKNSKISLLDSQTSNDFLSTFKAEGLYALNDQQKNAAHKVLTTKDFMIGIQGDAGTAKTSSVAAAVFAALASSRSDNSVELVGLAPTNLAAQTLEKAGGFSSFTIDAFLAKKESESDEIKEDKKIQKVYLVDESSMLGTIKLSQLLKKIEKEDARVVLIGDSKQLSAVEAGSMFAKMQEHSIVDFEFLDKSLRQKTIETKLVVEAFKLGKIDDAIDLLEKQGNLTLNEDMDLNTKNIIENYTYDLANGIESAMLVNTNAERDMLNELAHQSLKAANIIDSSDHSFNLLRSSKINDGVEKFVTEAYKENMVLINSRKMGNFSQDSKLKILEIDKNAKKVLVEEQKTKQTRWISVVTNAANWEVFENRKQSFSIGEKIVFEKKNKTMGVQNGTMATIVSIEKDNLVVNDGKKDIKFSLGDYSHFSLAHAITAHKSQGQTLESVHVYANANIMMNNLKSAYVFVSRAKNAIKLYTNNKIELSKLFKYAAEKENVFERTDKKYMDPKKETKEISKTAKYELAKIFTAKKNQIKIEKKLKRISAQDANKLVQKYDDAILRARKGFDFSVGELEKLGLYCELFKKELKELAIAGFDFDKKNFDEKLRVEILTHLSQQIQKEEAKIDNKKDEKSLAEKILFILNHEHEQKEKKLSVKTLAAALEYEKVEDLLKRLNITENDLDQYTQDIQMVDMSSFESIEMLENWRDIESHSAHNFQLKEIQRLYKYVNYKEDRECQNLILPKTYAEARELFKDLRQQYVSKKVEIQHYNKKKSAAYSVLSSVLHDRVNKIEKTLSNLFVNDFQKTHLLKQMESCKNVLHKIEKNEFISLYDLEKTRIDASLFKNIDLRRMQIYTSGQIDPNLFKFSKKNDFIKFKIVESFKKEGFITLNNLEKLGISREQAFLQFGSALETEVKIDVSDFRNFEQSKIYNYKREAIEANNIEITIKEIETSKEIKLDAVVENFEYVDEESQFYFEDDFADYLDSDLKIEKHSAEKISDFEFEKLTKQTRNELLLADPSPIFDSLGIVYKQNGNRYIFKMRDEERTASANMYLDRSGVWKFKDFGSSSTGTIENVVMEVTGMNYKDALEFCLANTNTRNYLQDRLDELSGQKTIKSALLSSEIQEKLDAKRASNVELQKDSSVSSFVVSAKKITEYSLEAREYLASRGISSVPEHFFEIVGKFVKNGKEFFNRGIGVLTGDQSKINVQNLEKIGADIHFFKPITRKDGTQMKTQSFGPKDITFIPDNKQSTKVAVFESKMDYAAAFEQKILDNYNVIIANGVGNYRKVIDEIKKNSFDETFFFNQNDKAGEKFVQDIQNSIDSKIIKKIIYKNGEEKMDINDLLKNGVTLSDRVVINPTLGVEKMENPKEILVNLTKDVQLKINPKELMDIVALCKACIQHDITFSNVIEKIASRLELPQAEMFKNTADLVSTAVKSGVKVQKNDTIKTLGERVQSVVSLAQTATSKI